MEVKNTKRTKKYKELRDGLREQLEFSQKNSKQNLDLVEDYMSFWLTKEMLQEDIEKRGVSVESYNAKGQSIIKKNDSIAELVKVNAQMLKILQHLNIEFNTGDLIEL